MSFLQRPLIQKMTTTVFVNKDNNYDTNDDTNPTHDDKTRFVHI